MPPKRTGGVPLMRKTQLRPAYGRDYLSLWTWSTIRWFRWDCDMVVRKYVLIRRRAENVRSLVALVAGMTSRILTRVVTSENIILTAADYCCRNVMRSLSSTVFLFADLKCMRSSSSWTFSLSLSRSSP